MHKAVARHMAAAAAVQSGVIIGAPLHFELLQFVFADAILLDFANYGVRSGESGFAGEFGLVEDGRDHWRATVVAEESVDAAVASHGDLFLEHELAMDPSSSAAL